MGKYLKKFSDVSSAIDSVIPSPTVSLIYGGGGNSKLLMMDNGLDTSLQITGTSLNDLGIKEYDPQWEYVDMGSAGKWMKYNLGSTTEEGYGDYYAWGEVDTYYLNWTDRTTDPTEWKNNLGYERTPGGNYQWVNSDYQEVGTQPYNSSTLILNYSNDVIYQKSGGKFRMPTESELTALKNLTNTWTSINGVYGRQFTATNGNTLFIPSAGNFYDDYLEETGSLCCIVSSSRYSNIGAECVGLWAISNSISITEIERYYGCPIRGIKVE